MPTGLPHSPVATGSSLTILSEPKTPSPGLQGTLRLHNPQHGHRAQGCPPVPATCWATSASTWVHQPLPCPGLLPGVGTQQWPRQFCPCPWKPAVWWGGGSLVIQRSPAGSTLTPCHTPSWSLLVVTTSSVSSSRNYSNTAPPGSLPGPALPTPLLPAPPTGCPVNAGLPQGWVFTQFCGVTCGLESSSSCRFSNTNQGSDSSVPRLWCTGPHFRQQPRVLGHPYF